MSDKDIQKLQDLATRKIEKGVTKEEALRAFMEAGILDEKGNYTKNYPTLAEAFNQS